MLYVKNIRNIPNMDCFIGGINRIEILNNFLSDITISFFGHLKLQFVNEHVMKWIKIIIPLF